VKNDQEDQRLVDSLLQITSKGGSDWAAAADSLAWMFIFSRRQADRLPTYESDLLKVTAERDAFKSLLLERLL